MSDCCIKRFHRFVLLCLISLSLVIGGVIHVSPGRSQLPSFTVPNGAPLLPIGVERRGTLESASVRLDGRELFRIASPAVLNRSEPGTQIPVEVRATQVESNLEQLVTVGSVNGVPLDPETLEVVVETINGQPVLLAKDREQVEARVLLTVTDTDAQYHSTSQQNLATIWQRILEQELRQAIELRRPEAFRQQVILVTKVLSATVLLTVLLGAAWVALGRRRSRLKQQQVVVFFSKG